MLTSRRRGRSSEPLTSWEFGQARQTPPPTSKIVTTVALTSYEFGQAGKVPHPVPPTNSSTTGVLGSYRQRRLPEVSPVIFRPRLGWPYRRSERKANFLEYGCEDASSSEDDDDNEHGRKRKKARTQAKKQMVQIKKFLYGDLGLDPANEDDQVTVIAWSANANTTVLGYASMLRQVLRAGYPLTRQGVSLYTRERVRRKTLAAKSCKQYTFAINYLYSITGEDDKTRHALFSKGLGKMARLNPKTRGAMTEDMVMELINYPLLLTEKNKWMRDAFILLAATGVRQNQLINMRLDRCRFVKDSSAGSVYAITVDRNHKGRSSSYDDETECHVTNPVFGDHLDRIVQEAKSRRNSKNKVVYLSPRWDHTSAAKARKVVKEAASYFGWSDELSWVLHSTRDGAAVNAFLKAAPRGEKKALLKIQATTGHVTLNMLRQYAVPNEDRITYQRMKRDDAMLRLTGVVCDTLEKRYSKEQVGSMLRVCKIDGCFSHGAWKAMMEEQKRKRNRKK